VYGAVYGEPRLPCEGESIDAVRGLNEVSKVFETQEHAEPEGELVSRVNLTAFEHDPYSNVEWGKNRFAHEDLKRGDFPFQVTSERGEMDVTQYIQNHADNLDGFYQTIGKLVEFGDES